MLYVAAKQIVLASTLPLRCWWQIVWLCLVW